MSVNRSNFTLVFFKAAYHANPSVERKWAGSTHILQDTYLESLQLH